MHQELLSTGQVAKLIGIRRHRIEYAIHNGLLPDCKIRVGNKRAFDKKEIENIAEYFSVHINNNSSEEAAKGEK